MNKTTWQAEVQALSQELAELRDKIAVLLERPLATPGMKLLSHKAAVHCTVKLDSAHYFLGLAKESILEDWPGDREVG